MPVAAAADRFAPFLLLGILVALTGLVRWRLFFDDRRRWLDLEWRAVRAWAPFMVVYVVYRHLVAGLNPVAGAGLEDRLRALDERLLGVSPSFWMQRFASPWLTELMAYGYALMFVLPLVVLLLLHARERWEDFRAVGVSVLMAFYLGLALYLLVPARSPRLVYAYDVPLAGVFGLYEASTVVWDRLQTVQYDAFPSLHTAISTIALYWSGRHGGRRLFALFLPHVVLLQLATLYLRQHYFVDLIGGWALAAFVLWAARRATSMSWVRLRSGLGNT